MQVTRIFETVIYADDLVAAERFYHDVLGLEVYSRSDTVVSLRLAGGVLLVFNPDRASQPNRGVPSHGAIGPGHLAFSAHPDSLDHWRTHLTVHDVPIEMESTGSRVARRSTSGTRRATASSWPRRRYGVGAGSGRGETEGAIPSSASASF